MIAFADKEFYTNEYLCGKEAVIDTASFDFYIRKATQEIKRHTGKNVDENDIPECVKMCCCEVAELIYKLEKQSSTSDGKASESVGGWSVSYESKEQSTQVMRNNIKGSIRTWLTDTGLLYGGVRRVKKC